MLRALVRLAAWSCLVVSLSLVGCGGGAAPRQASGVAAGSRAWAEYPSGFDFRPPLSAAKIGLAGLNTAATPVVDIYAGTEAAKGALLRHFDTTEITIGDGEFHANWDTKAAVGGLPDGSEYCVIEVNWGRLLGFIDCRIDKPGAQGQKIADGQYFALKDGRTVPIKFVIDSTVPAPAVSRARLLVSDAQGCTIKEFDASSGEYLRDLVPAGGFGSGSPNDLTIGPDGLLYVTVNDASIKRFDSHTGASLGDVANSATAPLSDPQALRFGPDGRLYVSDTRGYSVRVFDTTSNSYVGDAVTWSSDGVSRPGRLAFSHTGMLLVTNVPDAGGPETPCWVKQYNHATGVFLGDLVPAAGSPIRGYAGGMATGSQGDLYVSSVHSPKVCVFDGASGSLLRSIAVVTVGGAGPGSLVVAPDGNLLVTMWNTIQRYDPNTGEFLDTLVSAGLPGQVNGIALAP